MKRLVIYVHGKGGNAQEAMHYRPLFPECDVVGLSYRAQKPWEAKEELARLYDRHSAGYEDVILIANSIGAYFSMCALADRAIEQALFISPIVDMERLIADMMAWAQVTEAELERRGEIPTDFGEVLSWEYLCYVRAHPIAWSVPTRILYGAKDHLTSLETISGFAQSIGAELTVAGDAEHWFHTDAQMKTLDDWVRGGAR